MVGPFTIDASVFLNARRSSERGHEHSKDLLYRILQEAIPVICPTLALPEVAATVSRGIGDAKLAREVTQQLLDFPYLTWVPLDESMAVLASDLAISHRLKGSDAVYVATASRYGCVLVTLDAEMHERSAGSIVAKYPVDILRTWKKSK